MQIVDYADKLIREIDAQMDQIRQHLAGGGAKTMEDYSQYVGQYKTLFATRSYIVESVKTESA